MKKVTSFQSTGEQNARDAIKFDILAIGQGKNAIPTDEPARMKRFFYTTLTTLVHSLRSLKARLYHAT